MDTGEVRVQAIVFRLEAVILIFMGWLVIFFLTELLVHTRLSFRGSVRFFYKQATLYKKNSPPLLSLLT